MEQPALNDEFITPEELAKKLKVSTPHIYVMVKRGLIPCYKIGKCLRFKGQDVNDFLKTTRRDIS